MGLDEADEEARSPPAVVAESVEEGEGVGGGVEDGEQDDREKDERDGSGVQEYQGEEQVVGWQYVKDTFLVHFKLN